MLIYDQSVASPDDELRALAQSRLPDEIEVAETDEYWVRARRSDRKIIFQSKADRMVEHILSLEDALPRLSARQGDCARAVLEMREVAR